jgi:hypothetical protein
MKDKEERRVRVFQSDRDGKRVAMAQVQATQ